MSPQLLACLTTAILAGCSGSQDPPRPAPVIALDQPTAAPSTTTSAAGMPSAEPEASAAPSATASSAPPMASAPSAAPPSGPPGAYPEEWIRLAQRTHVGLSCTELVYKNGCSQTRTGMVTFQVTIDAQGSVVKFSEVENTIHLDKALVSRCLAKNMPRWKFHAPEGHEPTFQVRVALGDRC